MLTANEVPIDVEQRECYARALQALRAAGVATLVGGGFALYLYLKRWRSTKDLDLFIRPDDVEPALAALAEAGFRVELTDPAWLAKALRDGVLIDLIFCSYNGLLPVDDSWIAHGRDALLLGVPVKLVGPEEMIVSKAFVAARDRFDGADISWMIRTLGPTLDWERIEERIDEHWEVLLWQLIHYLYVFPSDREKAPLSLVARLLERMRDALAGGAGHEAIRGPMLDHIQYGNPDALAGLAAALESRESR
jgi:hypothetical protein